LLDDRIGAATAGAGTLTLPGLVDVMEDAATVDLRGANVLPWVLRVLGRPADPRLSAAVDELRAWVASGAHRIDGNGDGAYANGPAVELMDAWWPRLVQAEFGPTMGTPLFGTLGA